MLNRIKKHAMALAALTIAIGFGSYTVAKSILAPTWYEITSSSPTSSENDQLGNPTMDPSQSGNCDITEDEIRCARVIDNPDNHNLNGLTVAQARLLSNVTIHDTFTYKPEE